MNLPGGWELILIVLVIMLLFGAKRLPDSARSLGRSMRILKAETKGLRDDDSDTTVGTDTTVTAHPLPPAHQSPPPQPAPPNQAPPPYQAPPAAGAPSPSPQAPGAVGEQPQQPRP